MADVAVSWATYCPENPARGRWDQAHIARLLNGEEWRVPGGFTFVDTPWTPDDGIGRVIVFPCGHYRDHEERHRVLDAFQRDLAKLAWSVVIATSDEASTFEWNKITLPEHCKLWVMTPRPEHDYPEGTFFIGEGCPWSSGEVAAHANENWIKEIDVFFAGQINHDSRSRMADALDELAATSDFSVRLVETPGFTEGLDLHDYLDSMCAARICPAPAGALTQDSFRFYEALEAQAIPLPDKRRADGGGERAAREARPGVFDHADVTHYWKMIFPDGIPRGVMLNWEGDFEHEMLVQIELGRYRMWQADTSAWWQWYKRSLAWRLEGDVRRVWLEDFADVQLHHGRANDDITVIIPTSPVPSNPDQWMIRATVDSVRERLPTAEIFITIDGVRDEQQDQADDYWEYARRLCAWTNTQPNIVPIVHREHMHQSGMMRDALAKVDTSMVLYVEHDTPLVGEIDFDACINMMFGQELSLLRFAHEATVLDEHKTLFLESTPDAGAFVRTIQWSQRPHLAGTDWYRDLMETHFAPEARTMIEDVMHGVAQHGAFTDRIQLVKAWERFRLAVYAPGGSYVRSTHLDGRAGDVKYPMKFAYSGTTPPGAPQPGTR